MSDPPSDERPGAKERRPVQPRRRRSGLWLFLLANVLGAAVVGGLLAGYAVTRVTAAGPLAKETAVVIPRGAGVDVIARRLAEAGVVADRSIFGIAARGVQAVVGPLRHGEYLFPARASMADVLNLMREGRTLVRRLTIAEGLTTREILAAVAAAEGLAGTVTLRPGEGELLPETYHYSWGDGRDPVITRMRASMRDLLAELWPKRQKGLPLETPDQAVTLASIVEKETGVAAERPRVAAVFINRLRRGMKLQSDPTVIYGLTEGKAALGRELTRLDLTSKSPYNTYNVNSLPPGPIANPGRASIEAVLNPPQTDELYFVADGTGGHVFARTLEEHNRNVAKWRDVQRQRGQR